FQLIALGAQLERGVIERGDSFPAVWPEGRCLAKLCYGLLPVLLNGQYVSAVEVIFVGCIYNRIHAWHFRSKGDVGAQRVERIVVAPGRSQGFRIADSCFERPFLRGDLAAKIEHRRVVWPDRR